MRPQLSSTGTGTVALDMPTEGKSCSRRSTPEGARTCGHFYGTLQTQRTGAQPFDACGAGLSSCTDTWALVQA